MLTQEQVEDLWERAGLDSRVQIHCEIVEQKSLEIARNLADRGIEVDEFLLRAGALLHDIGRGKSHDLDHGIVGAKLMRKMKVPEPICRIAETHVGTGLTVKDAKAHRLPEGDYLPATLEEKIVCYADTLIDHDHILDYERKLKEYTKRFGRFSGFVNRFILLHDELENFATEEEVREAEELAEDAGITRYELMENAGSAIAETLEEGVSMKGKTIAVFCGTGNNGGDGLVAARYLQDPAEVYVYLFGEPGTEEAKEAFKRAKEHGVPVKQVGHYDDLVGITADIAIDALLGTGIQGALREPVALGVVKMNDMQAYRVSVDVPSGMNPNTGETVECVKPDTVLCLHRFKRGLVGKFPVGSVLVLDIGIPGERGLL